MSSFYSSCKSAAGGVEIVGMTTHPDQAWMTQQARQVARIFGEQAIKPEFLIRDNDGKFVPSFDAILQEEGVDAPHLRDFRILRSSRLRVLSAA